MRPEDGDMVEERRLVVPVKERAGQPKEKDRGFSY